MNSSCFLKNTPLPGQREHLQQTKRLTIRLAGLFLLLLFYSTSCHSQPNTQTNDKPPDIILILVDDMGWSDIGSYGGEISTPNLDSLADKGIRFTQFYNNAKCFPSRSSLLSGLYAQQVGMDRQPNFLRNAVTLGEMLQSVGYRTLMVGKHHGTDNPYERGFDHYYGLRDGAANHFNPGLPREGEPIPAQKQPGKRWWCFDASCSQAYTPVEKDFYSTDYFTKWAIQFLDQYQDEEKPYFLYLSYQAPHDPLQAWPQDIAKYRDRYDQGYEHIATERYRRQLEMGLIDATYPLPQATYRQWDRMSEEEKNEQSLRMAVYAAMIDSIDQNIGLLLNQLRTQGTLDNTLIMFASDNGASAEVIELGEGQIGNIDRWASLGADWANVSNTPFRYFKNDVYEGGINTPFIAHWPQGIQGKGVVSDFAGHFIDIMATLVDITGASYPNQYNGQVIYPYEGESLTPIFQNREAERSTPLFWQWQQAKAIRSGNWKLLTRGGEIEEEEWELYNMLEDKTETNNLAETHPDIAEQLALRYQQWRQGVSKEN